MFLFYQKTGAKARLLFHNNIVNSAFYKNFLYNTPAAEQSGHRRLRHHFGPRLLLTVLRGYLHRRFYSLGLRFEATCWTGRKD